MGLGLSQVAGIINQHQGHLAIHSVVNSGTEFRVYLPPMDIDESPEFRLPRQQRKPIQGTQQRVLIVEDDSVALEATGKMVRHLQYQVQTVKNGKEALQLWQSDDQFDLVLADIVMPELDGFALSSMLKEMRPELPVVLMSGYPLVEPKDDGSSIRWLPKPFDLYDLSLTLHESLNRP